MRPSKLLSWMLYLSAISGAGGCDAPTPRDTADTASPADLDTQLWELLGDPTPLLLPEAPADGDYSAFPADPNNPITAAKVSLGRELFHEPGLAVAPADPEDVYGWSCATCHDARAGFGASSRTGRGIGVGGQGERDRREVRADYLDRMDQADIGLFPDIRLVNVAWRDGALGWQGDIQADPPYAVLESHVKTALNGHGQWPFDGFPAEGSVLDPDGGAPGSPAYAALFAEAFPERPASDQITRETVTLAIAAYLRTVVTDQAPFQQLLRGGPETAASDLLSDEAIRGAILFFGEGRCAVCHLGPALADTRFHTLGGPVARADDPLTSELTVLEWLEQTASGGVAANRGRANVTDEVADVGAFTVPSAYNAGGATLRRWGHGGAFDSLDAFLRSFTSGPDCADLDPALRERLSPIVYGDDPLLLTDEERGWLVAFLEEGLQDPTIEERYGPTGPLSVGGYPVPNGG